MIRRGIVMNACVCKKAFYYVPFQPGFEQRASYKSACVMEGHPLYGVVSDFYQFQVEECGAHTFTIPDGCGDFIFILKPGMAEAMLTVGKDHRAEISFEKHTLVFGIRLRPGAIKDILGQPAKNVINSRIPLHTLAAHNALIHQILDCSSFEERMAVATKHIMHTFRGDDGNFLIINYCTNRIIETIGTVTLHALSNETNYSIRYLESIFADCMGFSPKHFSSFVKLHKSLTLMVREKNGRTFGEIAQECGYYDQSHMNRSYQRLIGVVPSRFLNLIRAMEDI